MQATKLVETVSTACGEAFKKVNDWVHRNDSLNTQQEGLEEVARLKSQASTTIPVVQPPTPQAAQHTSAVASGRARVLVLEQTEAEIEEDEEEYEGFGVDFDYNESGMV